MRIFTVVLDDDPTGTQTVHDVPVVTCWDQKTLTDVMHGESDLFFILTNSRALSAVASTTLHEELMDTLFSAAEEVGADVEIMSRSDSTLRGHYPLECDIIRSAFEKRAIFHDGELIVPCFPEGQRVTINDIHYAGGVAVGETEFARDGSFGYSSSNLREWVEEKTEGKVKAEEVVSLSPADGSEAIAARLRDVSAGTTLIANAENYEDLSIIAEGIKASGKRILYRTAASFVKAYAGIPDQPLLTGEQLCSSTGQGGLVIVGSHTEKTTSQLNELLTVDGTECVELRVSEVLNGNSDKEVARVLDVVEKTLKSNRIAVVFTSRKLEKATETNSEDNLSLSVSVSKALVSVVRKLNIAPKFLIAKGGITSSDTATNGLLIRCSTVLGQALPGIPVWKCGPETRFPGLPYIIFPGNVGDADSLKTIVTKIIEHALGFARWGRCPHRRRQRPELADGSETSNSC